MYIGQNYINGKYQPHRQDFGSINPATEEEIGKFPNSKEHEVNEAVEVAKEAFYKWREVSRVQRAQHFDRLAQLVKRDLNRIAKAISVETGKTLNESRAEIVEALHMAQYTFGKGREPYGEVVASELAERDAYILRKPKGVVAIIAPWNFPFAIGGFWCAAPAILEGNTVVFKPSEDTPMVGQITAELYDEAGFPPGVFNMVHGDGSAGGFLAKHKHVNHICFTGSAEVGQLIRQECANSWHKTCSCELGSKSAVMVFADADMDLALSACLNSAFKLSGQRCVSSGRLLIEQDIYDKFIAGFVKMAASVQIGDPMSDKEILFGPLINKQQFERVQTYNHMTVNDSHCHVLLEGKKPEGKGYFLTPHVYSCEWANKPYLKQEVFGPHVAIIPFKNIDHAISIYNDTDYGLALGVVTNDFKKAREVRNRADFGMGYWNGGSIAAESHLPFGGVKKSGNGFPSAAGTFRAVTHEVSWSVNHGGMSFPQGLK